MGKEAISASNNGIIRLLISYARPTDLLSTTNSSLKSDIIEMLNMICRYFNVCCLINSDCVSLFVEGGGNDQCNLINDLIECLSIASTYEKNNSKLNTFYASIFELFTTFMLVNEEKSISNKCIFKITRFWAVLSNYLLDELLELESRSENNELFNIGLKFFSAYFSRLTQLVSPSSIIPNIETIRENVCLLFDSFGNSNESYGSRLCRKLIKLFDKFSNSNIKALVLKFFDILVY